MRTELQLVNNMELYLISKNLISETIENFLVEMKKDL